MSWTAAALLVCGFILPSGSLAAAGSTVTYLGTLAESLSSGNSAALRLKLFLADNKQANRDFLAKFRSELNLSVADFEKAAKLIQDYKSSQENAVRSSAHNAETAYLQYARSTRALVEQIDRVLRNPVTDGSVAEEIARVRLEYESYAGLIQASTQQAAFAVVEKLPTGSLRMKIAAKDRQDLTKKIEGLFAHRVLSRAKEERTAFEQGAAVLYHTLTDPRIR